MGASNFNMDDPAKQEAIRRGPHEYIAGVGKHGVYVKKEYKHQEYPKMMGKWPRPELKSFLTQNGVAIPVGQAEQNLAVALREWDECMTRSIVNNAAEERQWLKENAS